jgi:tetratricopeptide (TPR) repeat protein
VTGRSTSSEARYASRYPSPRVLFALLVLITSLCACDRTDEIPRPPAENQACIDADGLRRLGDPAGALALAETALVQYPASIPVHRVLQDALRDLGREEETRERYQQLHRQHPDDPSFLYLLGRTEFPDDAAARPHFDACLAVDPAFVWCTIAEARLEAIGGDRFGALQILREAIDGGRGEPELFLSAGFLYLDMRLLRDAERSFQAVLDVHPWDSMALGGLGQVETLLGRDLEATELLERALSIDPSRTDLLGTLAYVRYETGDLEDAWDTLALQQEIDGSADPMLIWKLEGALQREMPFTVVLGPYYLTERWRTGSR